MGGHQDAASPAAAWLPARRWRTAGAVLLLVGAATFGTTHQQALMVIGLLLLADGGIEEAPTPEWRRAPSATAPVFDRRASRGRRDTVDLRRNRDAIG